MIARFERKDQKQVFQLREIIEDQKKVASHRVDNMAVLRLFEDYCLFLFLNIVFDVQAEPPDIVEANKSR